MCRLLTGDEPGAFLACIAHSLFDAVPLILYNTHVRIYQWRLGTRCRILKNILAFWVGSFNDKLLFFCKK